MADERDVAEPSVLSDPDAESRAAILRRRALLVASALAGVIGAGCSDEPSGRPGPCLSAMRPPSSAPRTTTPPTTTPMQSESAPATSSEPAASGSAAPSASGAPSAKVPTSADVKQRLREVRPVGPDVCLSLPIK